MIFRDLKPENILLNKDMHIQITDFGSAKILSKEDQTKPEEGNYYHVFFSLCSCFSCQLKFKICCFIQFFESLLSFFRLPGKMPCDLLPSLDIHRRWKFFTFKSSYFSGTTNQN